MNDKKEAILSRKYMEYMNAYDVITFDMQWVMTRVEHSIDATGWIQNQVIEELGNVYPECIKEGDDLWSLAKRYSTSVEAICEVNDVTEEKLCVGDKLLITGPTTGALFLTLDEARVDLKPVDEVKKGQRVSFKVDEKIRPSDKLYKLVAPEELKKK